MNTGKDWTVVNFDQQSAKPGHNMRIGVSACLLGNQVRFDGGHKRDRFVTDSLSDCFQLVPFCPEVAIGMGIPRQPIRLVGNPQDPQAVGVKQPDLDVTADLQAYGRQVGKRIEDLCGFIFKKDSPSCGMTRVKVYNLHGMAERTGTGLFASEIMQADPLLPVEEEGRLNDAHLRENFITRVFVYARWKAMMAEGLGKSALIGFHSCHKYLLMAHDTVAYRELGRLLSNLNKRPLEITAASYIEQLMQALRIPATRKRHTDVLQHLMGYLKKDLDADHRADLSDAIEAYRQGLYPLVVPVRLLQHHFSAYPKPYIRQQAYLNPHPPELMLRNSHGGR